MDNSLIHAVKSAATKNGINEAALLAVVEVESSGIPLWKVGANMLPPIRFEGHYFYERLSGDKLAEAIKQGLANKKAGVVKNPRSYAARYEFLERAKKIDHRAALESTSWGAGQVMGAHWGKLGYGSVDALVKAASTVEGQVDMIVRYLQVNDLVNSVNARKWERVAYGYNGPKYKRGNYHTKLAEAYSKYSGTPVLDYVNEDKALIMQVQTMLNAVGTYNLTVDGSFGDNTKAALIDFQIKNGLVADGIYGPISREELEKDYKETVSKKEDIIGKLGAGAGAAGTALSEAAKQIEPLASTSQWLQYLFIGLTVAGILFTLKATVWK